MIRLSRKGLSMFLQWNERYVRESQIRSPLWWLINQEHRSHSNQGTGRIAIFLQFQVFYFKNWNYILCSGKTLILVFCIKFVSIMAWRNWRESENKNISIMAVQSLPWFVILLDLNQKHFCCKSSRFSLLAFIGSHASDARPVNWPVT